MLLIDELYHLSKVQNDDIVKIIDDFNLRRRCRKQEYVYKRYFLAQYMVRRRHMTTMLAAYYLGIDHSTVVYGIQQHDFWWKHNDHRYMAAIFPLPELLSGEHVPETYKVDFQELDIEDTVVNIRGNFPPKLLTKLSKPLTGKELSNIFAMS